jgi:hypothetical protein
MNTALLNTPDGTFAARTFGHGDSVFYTIDPGDSISGTILVQPSRLGMHPRYGVMLTFGGYDGHIDAGDFAVSGTVVASGDDMTPGPHPTARQYPLGQVRADDPDTADMIADLVTAIAFHYADNYSGTGLR